MTGKRGKRAGQRMFRIPGRVSRDWKSSGHDCLRCKGDASPALIALERAHAGTDEDDLLRKVAGY